jgi:uncharacterized protein
MERADELVGLVLGTEWLRNLLGLVALLELPDCWIGAGAVRDLVWDTRFGNGFDPARIEDVDVVFFDPDDLSAIYEEEIERKLSREEPSVKWDVKNQARVHVWFESKFGRPLEPLTSTAAGVATWPETATAVAVRLSPDPGLDITGLDVAGHDVEFEVAGLQILAPFGLDDLLNGIWRRNLGTSPETRVSDDEFRARTERKQPQVRWPHVVVLER